jgi:hypothetical protein
MTEQDQQDLANLIYKYGIERLENLLEAVKLAAVKMIKEELGEL